eukprot:2118356-Alexandrium_andersonii.AAC.1
MRARPEARSLEPRAPQSWGHARRIGYSRSERGLFRAFHVFGPQTHSAWQLYIARCPKCNPQSAQGPPMLHPPQSTIRPAESATSLQAFGA